MSFPPCSVVIHASKASTLTIRIPPELKQSAEAVAREHDTTVSQLVRSFLRDYVSQNRQKSLLDGGASRTKSKGR